MSISDAPAFVRRRVIGTQAEYTACNTFEVDLLRTCISDGGKEPHVSFVPNWPESEWNVQPGEAKNLRLIVWTGRLDAKVKGIWTLLDALEKAIDQGEDVLLRIVGTGPDEIEIRDRILRSSNLSAHVSLVGRIDDRAKLVQLVSEAAVFVNSSIQEGFPISVLEALAVGCKLVLTPLPYTKSEIEGAPGVHVSTSLLSEDVCSALISALKDNASPADIIEWSRNNFNAKKSMDRLITLIHATEMKC
jgi:glycosyltransferase involved in cell wall biosynthesis